MKITSWSLQASNDGFNWQSLMEHHNDTSLKEPGSVHTFHLTAANTQQALEDGTTGGWRYFRIFQTGPNASGKSHYLSLSGWELYGLVTGVFSDVGRWRRETMNRLQLERQLIRKYCMKVSRVYPFHVNTALFFTHVCNALARSCIGHPQLVDLCIQCKDFVCVCVSVPLLD